METAILTPVLEDAPAAPQTTEAVLSLRGICKKFTQGATSIDILNGVNLNIQPGETVSLVGQSGSGKSTLLHIAGLLDIPTQGSVWMGNKECSALSDGERTLIRRQKIGFIYQFHHLLPEFSAVENAAMPLIIAGRNKKEAHGKAASLLESLGLKDRLKHRPSEMSGGEQQRVAIARAMVHTPQVILADEPTGNLDPSTSEHVFSLFVEAAHTHKIATLIVTHNERLSHHTSRRLVLEKGMLAGG